MKFCHLVCPRPSSKSQTKPSSQMQWGVGAPPRPRAPCKGPSDLDEAGKAQAEGRVHRHRAALDLVPVQAKHLQLGEVHDVHHGAEAADGELCGDRRSGVGGRSADQGPGSTGRRLSHCEAA